MQNPTHLNLNLHLPLTLSQEMDQSTASPKDSPRGPGREQDQADSSAIRVQVLTQIQKPTKSTKSEVNSCVEYSKIFKNGQFTPFTNFLGKRFLPPSTLFSGPKIVKQSSLCLSELSFNRFSKVVKKSTNSHRNGTPSHSTHYQVDKENINAGNLSPYLTKNRGSTPVRKIIFGSEGKSSKPPPKDIFNISLTSQRMYQVDKRITELIMDASSQFFEYLPTYRSILQQNPLYDWNIRSKLAKWVIQVGAEFGLLRDTIQTAIIYMDRYLGKTYTFPPQKYQILVIVALLVASKFHEQWSPSVPNFCSITDNLYTPKEVKNLEKELCFSLDWNLVTITLHEKILCSFKRMGLILIFIGKLYYWQS